MRLYNPRSWGAFRDRHGIIPGMNLNNIKTLLIDGDGVLWRLNEPMPGLSRFFDVLDQRGINWALLTNNSTRTLANYVDKLRGFRIQATSEQIFSSASVTASTLQKRYPPGTAFYVIGAEGLKQTLTDAGFAIHDGEKRPETVVAGVVVGMDVDLTYRKLATATLLIRSGVSFVATNPDRTFPAPQGILPGAGSIVALLVASTDAEPEVIGKPEPAIFQAAMEHFSTTPETTAMLGDRMETDILGAHRLGIGTILVLSGVTRRDDLGGMDYQPDLVVDDIITLADLFEKTT